VPSNWRRAASISIHAAARSASVACISSCGISGSASRTLCAAAASDGNRASRRLESGSRKARADAPRPRPRAAGRKARPTACQSWPGSWRRKDQPLLWRGLSRPQPPPPRLHHGPPLSSSLVTRYPRAWRQASLARVAW
jgi:hypothetical protein